MRAPKFLRSTDILRAYHFAAKAHHTQVRKYTHEPYIVHPVAVAYQVTKVQHTKEMVMAALLHDVVEDTKCTIQEIKQEFGPVVGKIVAELTEPLLKEDGYSRAIRKSAYQRQLAQASVQAQTIKLADLLDNCVSIVQHDPKFARTYLREKSDLLKVMTRGDPQLYARALTLVRDE